MAPGAGGPPMYQPTFAGDPTPMPEPQFCPPGGPGSGGAEKPSPLSLPNDGSPNAWDCPEPAGCNGPGWYVNLGYTGLMRQSFGGGPLVVRDPGVNLPGIPSNVDSGNLPPPGSPQLLGLNDLSPVLMNGVRATVAYREGCDAFEITGFYIFQTDSNTMALATGQLDLPFAFFPTPLGFQGDNGLWLQADKVFATLSTSIGSAEANYRHSCYPGCEFILGVRYLNLREDFSLTTDDSSTVAPINPTQIATVISKTRNQIIAPQLGLEFEKPLLSCLTVGITAKGAWGVNILEQENQLVRADGFVGPSSHHTTNIFSHIYDLSAWGTLLITDQFRIRAGYQALWVVHVPEAAQNISFALGQPDAFHNTSSILYHGPMIEFQFSF
jgi:hypothetical protein